MWALVTSDGRWLAEIGSEEAARRTVHALGTTQWRGPFSWDVVAKDGRRFVAEIRHCVDGANHDSRKSSTYAGHRRDRGVAGRPWAG
jgi:hypothetical protein